MQDKFLRTVDYLRVSVTDRCNLRCRYCMPDGIEKLSHSKILRFEEVVEIVETMADMGIRKVRVTGGEPLVRRGVVDLCRSLGSIPGIREVVMTTNGMLLEEYAEGLRSAGVKRLNISLDTLRPDRFAAMTGTDALDRVLRGIAAAEAAGLTPIKLNTVLIGGFNDDEVRDLAELTRERDISVRFIELMPMGGRFSASAYLSGDDVLRQLPELEEAGSDGVARLYRLPDGKGTVGLISPLSHAFCASCSRLRLTSEGALRPCLHSSAEVPLRGLHGDALRHAVEEAVAMRVATHGLLDAAHTSGAGRTMNTIGG